MAGGSEKGLKQRIKSVQSTKKITKAMEMVSASRIQKAQQRLAAARPYSEHMTEVIRNLARSGGNQLEHPMLNEKDTVEKVGFVVLSSDRGLAGGYNAAVIRAAEGALQEHRAEGRGYSLILVGKKATSAFRFKGYRIDASFTGISDKPTYEDARMVAGEALRRFNEGEVDQVELVYTRFLSVGSQRTTVTRLIPVDAEALTEGPEEGQAEYEFEPAPNAILEDIMPRYVEAKVYSALLQASASEHASRQRAMKAATDNAEELITNLERQANRARQETITTEIMEIVGGAEAMRQAQSSGGDLIPDYVARLDYLPDELGYRTQQPPRATSPTKE